MGKINYLMIVLLFININCYRGLVKKHENRYQVEGAVSYKDKFLVDAAVEIFLENEVLKNGFRMEHFMRLKTDANGKFAASLPQNYYYFIARKGSLFSYYGGNPVSISGPRKDLLLKCVKKYVLKRSIADDLAQAELSGKILDVSGNPLQDAYVYLFSSENINLKRKSEIVSQPSLKDGSFSVSIGDPGTYFLVARKRKDIQENGPLKIGDYYGYYDDNPVEINNKEKLSVILECEKKKKELGPTGLLVVPLGKSAIRGKILWIKDKKPVKGIFAFAYKDEFVTGEKPDYKSMLTDEYGNYVIIIEKEGSYVIGARRTYGGPPEPGDVFGLNDLKIEIKKGEVKDNIDIIVEDIK